MRGSLIDLKWGESLSLSPFLGIIDGMGIYGNFLHYAIVISLVGSAFLIFLYLWSNQRLDIDEEPKFQMMQEEELKEGEGQCQMKQKKK